MPSLIEVCCFFFFNLERDNWRVFFLFIEFIGVILVNKIIQVSGAQFHNTSSVPCIVCSPPQLTSPSITFYPHYTLFHHLPPPFPSNPTHGHKQLWKATLNWVASKELSVELAFSLRLLKNKGSDVRRSKEELQSERQLLQVPQG